MAFIQMRNAPDHVAARFAQGAAARGITQAEYLEKLLDLHAWCREHVATGCECSEARTILTRLGLQSVEV